ncbi:MAG: CmpA/NrtA family ABC transporter substrate-binding protein [Pseudomonadota bacterium]
MKSQPLKIGFVRLLDAAPLIVASEMGFAQEEGLAIDLQAAPSWSALRDRLCFGQLDAAHMLAPVPVAGALGLGGAGAALHALAVLSVNGNVIGVSRELGRQMREMGHRFGFDDAHDAGRALIAAKGASLRVGVPFPFSMHAELVYYWLTALGLPAPQSVDVRTVPPPLMADALARGELDAFCVGEPWGSRSVDAGVADLLLPSSAIWAAAPEKVLAVRAETADQEPDINARLIRAVWRAARWIANPESRGLTTEILSHPQHLDLPAEVLERALHGRFVISAEGDVRGSEFFVNFFHGAAGFPWRSQAEWMGLRMAMRTGLDRDEAAQRARATFRSDIYRTALEGVAHDLPLASSKVEGAIADPMPVSSIGGTLILPKDSFFDGRVFEPLEV